MKVIQVIQKSNTTKVIHEGIFNLPEVTSVSFKDLSQDFFVDAVNTFVY